ncbi:hypothetical protein [Meiothermus sp.]|uniref:hypothetical protein n=1 Tax=Meiothermus sp. TaxID=1955249 RepID=UPI0025F2852F|nr:hypothetical protein [Meiothermus sp.]
MAAQPSSNDILSVLRLLIRGKLPVERVAGKRWGWLEDALAWAGFSGLVIVELPGGELARLLYHQGALVYLAWKEHSPGEGAAKIQQTALQATFSVYPFDEARQTLALAAVDGVIVRSGQPLEAPPARLWREFQRRHFSGVLALEDRAILHITLFQDGIVRLGAEPPVGFEPSRQILIAWTQRVPERLNLNLQPLKPWPSSSLASPNPHHEAIWNLVHQALEAHLGFQAGLVEMRLRRELYHLEAQELIENLVAWLAQHKHPGLARELHQQLYRVQYRAFYEHFD